jgi:ADP-ribose pyrophosphatase
MEKEKLSKPPIIVIETLDKKEFSSGFLTIDRRKLKFTYPDNTVREMEIDTIVRDRNDAVVILAHYLLNGTRYIYLRSALRPALATRNYLIDRRPETFWTGNEWELPAGLVETDELGEQGLLSAASRELEEEIGFKLDKEKFLPLGVRTFPCVGIFAERLYFFEVEVNPEEIKTPTEDGSALEYGGNVCAIPLKVALEEVEKGFIVDSKTEIGLYRLIRKYND